MASTIPAMRGTLGTTEYFIVTLKAKNVAEKMRAAADVPGWDDLSLEQRYQREINLTRVRRDIAPYLAENADRFFGALIVAVQNSTRMKYEPVKEVVRGSRAFSGSHDLAADNLGFLTFGGEEVLVPIDGQHRAKALDYAIRGRDDQNKQLDFEANPNVATDDITVILIRFDSEADQARARRIFSKVNRYAKKPTKSEELIIDDDDIAAVFSRRITEPEEEMIPGELVRFSGNTLSEKANEFTTLPTLYEINKEILVQKGHEFSKTKPPPMKDQRLYWKEVKSVWQTLIEEISLFSHALKDTSKSGRRTRQEIRREYLLGKPIGQRVLAGAFCELTEKGRMSAGQACDRLNKVDWRIKNPMWLSILTRDETRVHFGLAAIRLGKDFVTYLTGRPLPGDGLDALRERISPDDGSYELPDPLFKPLPIWKAAK